MKSAVFDFAAIARASAPSPRFNITEGSAVTLSCEPARKLRSVLFSDDKGPSYPAIVDYDPATDQAFWVECTDPFTIHLARRKNAAALGVALKAETTLPLTELSRTWGERLWRACASNNLQCAFSEPIDTRVGALVMIKHRPYPVHQMHVSWEGEINPEDAPVELLAASVAKKIAPHRMLHSQQLWCPTTQAEGVALAFNNLRARAVRCVIAIRDADDAYSRLAAVTRIDIAFAVEGELR